MDDNATNLKVLSYVLDGWNIAYEKATSAQGAIDILESDQAFDFALLDYHMPGEMDGLDLCWHMNKNAAGIPIITLSSSFDVTQLERPKNLKFWLYKPVKPERLKNYVLQVLHQAVEEEQADDFDPDNFDPQREIKILLAEDNVVNQKVFSRMLDKLGYLADIVSDGSEAVISVERQSYDVVFMDVQMPNMDGLEATAEIRRLGETISQPHIVALTAELNATILAECKNQGMNSALQKPASVNDILRALGNAHKELEWS
ncbi:MAG: response regulator [Chloroflexota bacterium]